MVTLSIFAGHLFHLVTLLYAHVSFLFYIQNMLLLLVFVWLPSSVLKSPRSGFWLI